MLVLNFIYFVIDYLIMFLTIWFLLWYIYYDLRSVYRDIYDEFMHVCGIIYLINLNVGCLLIFILPLIQSLLTSVAQIINMCYCYNYWCGCNAPGHCCVVTVVYFIKYIVLLILSAICGLIIAFIMEILCYSWLFIFNIVIDRRDTYSNDIVDFICGEHLNYKLSMNEKILRLHYINALMIHNSTEHDQLKQYLYGVLLNNNIYSLRILKQLCGNEVNERKFKDDWKALVELLYDQHYDSNVDINPLFKTCIMKVATVVPFTYLCSRIIKCLFPILIAIYYINVYTNHYFYWHLNSVLHTGMIYSSLTLIVVAVFVTVILIWRKWQYHIMDDCIVQNKALKWIMYENIFNLYIQRIISEVYPDDIASIIVSYTGYVLVHRNNLIIT
eukprot:283647_1